MSGSNIIKKEFIFPNEDSTKKQWRYTYKCSKCDRIDSKWYRKGTFTGVCRHCSKGGYDTATFIAKSKEFHGDKYDYSKSVYKNKRTKLEIICPTHGSFFIRAGDHMTGSRGCIQCAIDKSREVCTITLDVWKQRLEDRHPHITLLSSTLGYHNKTKFLCTKHGEFETYLGEITGSTHLCPTCYITSHRKQPLRSTLLTTNATIYYVYLQDLQMYKLGVTTNTIKQRLGKLSFNVIMTLTYPYTEAIELEHYLHTKLTEYRYADENKLMKEGSRELYSVDVKNYILELIGLYGGDSI